MTLTRTIAWHHIKCAVPAEWEATSYSVEERQGRLEFSDRAGIRGLFSWESCKREPDTETTILSFLRSRETGVPDTRLADLKTHPVGEFRLGYAADSSPCQAICYRPDRQKLLRWIFPDARADRLTSIYMPILQSCAPNAGSPREYRLFGINATVPADYEIEQMNVYPANVRMLFESKSKRRLVIRRWGLPELILGGLTLAAFYERFLRSEGYIVTKVQDGLMWRGMPAVQAQYQARGEHQMDRFMGRLWTNGTALLWHDPAEKRIYTIEQIGPPDSVLLDPEKVVMAHG